MDVVLKNSRFATNNKHHMSKLLVYAGSLCADALYLGKVSTGEDIKQAGLSASAVANDNKLPLNL